MNTTEIRKMLCDIRADYVSKGRKSSEQDDIIINAIMHLYCVTYWMDWEECKWLFVNYIETGILDFPAAQKMARKRMVG